MPTLQLTSKAPEDRPGPKRKIVFQPSTFRCKLLVLGRATPKYYRNIADGSEIPNNHRFDGYKTLKIMRFQLPSPQLVQPPEIQPSNHSKVTQRRSWPHRNMPSLSRRWASSSETAGVGNSGKEESRKQLFFLCASWGWNKFSDLSITDPNTQEDFFIQTPKKISEGTLKRTYPENIQRLVFGFSSLGMSRDFFCCWAFGTIQLGSLQYPPVGLAQLSNQLEKNDPKWLHTFLLLSLTMVL